MRTRAAGLLLHPTSLPGRFGSGDLGPSTESLLDFLVEAGLSAWQFLPLGPVGYGDSPYGCLSAFAGNPFLISPERLVEEGFLPAEALESVPPFPAGEVDFGAILPWKRQLLRSSWTHFQAEGPQKAKDEFLAFVFHPEQSFWIEDWALFAALARESGRTNWASWDPALVRREPEALSRARAAQADEVAYQEYLQFLFFRQWGRVRADANRRGIALVGDVPIYLSYGSADVWANQSLFDLDENARPVAVSGVPPDYFSETGQLWGNPLYRWDRMEADGFSWWVARMRMNFRMADVVRMDHFRGFAGYWRVPAGEETAINGAWVSGPGTKLFDAIRDALGETRIVAEDLGVITPDVRALIEATGFPGMKILQFAWSEIDHECQPHRHVPNGVVYTGTHDNDTTLGWWTSAPEAEKALFRRYLRSDGADPVADLVRATFLSVADLAVVPAQDLLRLGADARMNTPGHAQGNWRWRLPAGALTAGIAAGVRQLGELSGRCGVRPAASPGGASGASAP